MEFAASSTVACVVGGCCTLGKAFVPGDIPDNLDVHTVCFRTDSGGVHTLESIRLTKYEWGGP